MIEFLFYLLFPIILGGIGGIFSNTEMYKMLINPPFAPPSILFPIVWTILYAIMGITSYMVRDNKKAIRVYLVQLFINVLWTLIFFNFKKYLLSFIWIIILIILVLIMIIRFYKVNKNAGLLNIPYLLWLIFASYLTLGVYILNS